MSTRLGTRALQRVIVRAGGLYTPADLARICGETAKRWPGQKGFPEPVWRAGPSDLYAGWDVYEWCEKNNHPAAAAWLYRRLNVLRVKKR